MTKEIEQKKSSFICHFQEMEFAFADNGAGGCEQWMECKYCGHTKDVPKWSVDE